MGLFDLFQENIGIEEGLEKMKEVEGAVLLDVRSEGHLEGSINLPINRLPTISIDKSVPIFIYCLSGARARRAEAFLRKSGYEAVNIGGINGYQGKLVRS